MTRARRANIDLPGDLAPPFKEGDIIVPHDATYPEGALRVTGIEGGDLLAYPLGGGRQYRFPPQAWLTKYRFRIVSDAEIASRGWKQLLVSIEGEPPIFKAWSDGTYWNGWEIPHMDAHNRDRYIRFWNERGDEWSDDIGQWVAEHIGNGNYAWYSEPTDEVVLLYHEGSQYVDGERFENELKPKLIALKPRLEVGDYDAYREFRDILGELGWIEGGKKILTPAGDKIDVWNIMGGNFIWSEHPLRVEDLEAQVVAGPEDLWDAPNDPHPFRITEDMIVDAEERDADDEPWGRGEGF